MKEITHQNLHSFCRTCLVELEEKSSLLGEKYNIQEDELLEELIALYASMPVEDDIKFPNFVCRKCYEKLQSFNDFRCQTMQSLSILNNIIENLNENKTTEDDKLDSGQGSEEKLECNASKMAEDIYGSKNWQDLCNEGAAGYTNTTRSQEKLQNCIENAVVKILQDPTDYTPAQVVKMDHKKETRREIEELEINISDNKMESVDDVAAFEFFETPRNKLNPQHGEDRLQNLEISIQTPSVQDIGYATECRISNGDIFALSARSPTRCKSIKAVRINIKKPTKRTNDLVKKCTKSKSKSVITGGAVFQCDQCPRRCLTWENYESHLRTHQDLKPYVCQECGRSFNKADRCRAHVREVHAPVALQYICSYEGCDKVFKREGSYQMHYRLKHKYADRESKIFVCEECGSTFKNATKFKEHHYKHVPVEQYPFKCDDCGKRYRSKRTFKEHQLRHSGIKKYICPYCGMKKPTQHELRAHINYHTKEKQWSCTNCTSVFSSSANLGRHFRVVHKGVRQYACSYCDERFGKQETLKHHEIRHTVEKPHGCKVCGKRFTQVVALRAHMKVHNKGTARSQNKLPLTEKLVKFVDRTVNSEADSIDSNMQSVKEFNSSSINITS